MMVGNQTCTYVRCLHESHVNKIIIIIIIICIIIMQNTSFDTNENTIFSTLRSLYTYTINTN